jgi:AcrR family transcriptional regulator
MNATQIKILEAAESELAECGFAGASIRNITQRAGVNVASINYHFGSKVELIKELFKYRIMPLNELRLGMLEKAKAKHEDGIVPVYELVDILVRPTVSRLMGKEGRRFVQAMARCMSEPLDFMRELDEEIFQEMFTTFHEAFQKALPSLDPGQVMNKLNFIICTMVGFMMHFPRMDQFIGHDLSKDEFQNVVDEYIEFIAAGVESARIPIS